MEDTLVYGRLSGQNKFLLVQLFKVEKIVERSNGQYPYKQRHEQETRQKHQWKSCVTIKSIVQKPFFCESYYTLYLLKNIRS